jgi:hypothetical protein
MASLLASSARLLASSTSAKGSKNLVSIESCRNMKRTLTAIAILPGNKNRERRLVPLAGKVDDQISDLLRQLCGQLGQRRLKEAQSVKTITSSLRPALLTMRGSSSSRLVTPYKSSNSLLLTLLPIHNRQNSPFSTRYTPCGSMRR